MVVIYWWLYFGLHSGLASNGVKKIVKNLGFPMSGYRLVYSGISTVGLLYVLYLVAVTPSQELFVPPGYLRYIAMILASWGIILIVVSFRHISLSGFVGLSQIKDERLTTEGIHGYVRHPIYSGVILILAGMVLYNPTDIMIVSAVAIGSYLPVGIYLEEMKLIRQFGVSYLEYRESVPAIFPKVLR